jgi:hypothetical protein
VSRAEQPVAAPGGTALHPADRERFLDLVLGADDDAPAAYVDALVRCGVPVDAVYMELLAPTAEALGRMWSDDACDFVDVTLATGRLQRAVRELGHGFVGTRGRRRGGRAACCSRRCRRSSIRWVCSSWPSTCCATGGTCACSRPDTPAELASAVRGARGTTSCGFSAACDSRLLALRHEVPPCAGTRATRTSPSWWGRIFVDIRTSSPHRGRRHRPHRRGRPRVRPRPRRRRSGVMGGRHP